MTYDAIVVGAGPAGSTCAYRLAEAGASVLLLDRASFPRDKPCGGGVTLRALKALPVAIDPVVEEVVTVAELRPVEQKRTEPRLLGGAKGIVIPPSFFDPMPDDFLDTFESGPVYPPVKRSRSARVAETSPTYRATSRRKRSR